MPMIPSRVVLVEDDDLLREGVSSALRTQGYDVRAEGDGTRLEQVLDEFQPHVALLDVTLPVGPDGFELAERIRAAGDIPFMFLTASVGIEDRVRGLDLGADDYLVKPFSMKELSARVRALLRRVVVPTQPVITVGDVVIDTSMRTVHRAGAEVALTPTEFDILVAIAQRAGTPCTKAFLLEEVWGLKDNSRHLVEVQMSGLRRKLEVHGPRLIVTCRGGAYTIPA